MRDLWNWIRTQGWLSAMAILQSPGRDGLRFAVTLCLDLLFFLLVLAAMCRFQCGFRLSLVMSFLLVLVAAPHIRSLVEDIIPSGGGQSHRGHEE